MAFCEVKRVNRVDPDNVENFITMSNMMFLEKDISSSFLDQPASVLIRPSSSLTASLHYMFFPAAFTQPIHYHPDPRLLLIASHSEMTVEHWKLDGEHLSLAHSSITEPGDITTIRIASREWHRFSAADSGKGAIAFTFHPHDSGDEDLLASPKLMEALTTFAVA